MNLRPEHRDEPEVSLTPLIDVVFLLLIFFMVSTTFERESRIRLQLPEASAELTQIEENKLEITIDRQGRYFVNGMEVINTRIATLKAAIAKAKGDKGDLQIIIRADAQTPHQAVVTAMDAARQLGMYRLSLATTQTDRNPGHVPAK